MPCLTKAMPSLQALLFSSKPAESKFYILLTPNSTGS